MKKYRLTIILALVLLVLSLVSISIGAVDIKFSDIFKDPTKLRLILVSRLPRLLAILCPVWECQFPVLSCKSYAQTNLFRHQPERRLVVRS